MLLGIYEDTGSLTYSRTSTRDLRAVAFLLDNGSKLADRSGLPQSSALKASTGTI